MASREQRIATTFMELADTLLADFDGIDFLHTLAMRSVELLEVSSGAAAVGDEHLEQVCTRTGRSGSRSGSRSPGRNR